MKEFPYAYIRKKIVKSKDATVPVQCKALQYGLGCFSGIRGFWNAKDKNIYFVWTLISSKLRKKSIQKLKKLKIPNSRFITIIHPNSNISNFTNIGKGVTIHAFVNIGPNTFIGDHVHIFSQSSIGHDTKIKSYSYLSGKSSIGANVNVDEGCFFGLNSSTRENLKIKSWSTIGMGSVVINNVQSNSTVVGNPAKKLKK